MKRKGMVGTYPTPWLKPSNSSELSPRPTKVLIKPTKSHRVSSGFKSKGKAKGAQKSSDYGLITRRLLGFKLSGFSASSVLDHLATIHYVDYDHEEDDDGY